MMHGSRPSGVRIECLQPRKLGGLMFPGSITSLPGAPSGPGHQICPLASCRRPRADCRPPLAIPPSVNRTFGWSAVALQPGEQKPAPLQRHCWLLCCHGWPTSSATSCVQQSASWCDKQTVAAAGQQTQQGNNGPPRTGGTQGETETYFGRCGRAPAEGEHVAEAVQERRCRGGHAGGLVRPGERRSEVRSGTGRSLSRGSKGKHRKDVSPNTVTSQTHSNSVELGLSFGS